MGDKTERGLVSKAAHKSGSLFVSFLWRWGLWTVILGVIATAVAQSTWPHIYEHFGLPMGIGEGSVYKAVEYGVLVTSVFGGAAVGFVGTVRR